MLLRHTRYGDLMDKRSEQIFNEINQMERTISEDMERTARDIKRKRNKEMSKHTALDYTGGYGIMCVYTKMRCA